MTLKVARAIKDYTQEDLSKKSGVCRTTISLIEKKGISGVTVDVVKKLAVALEIPIIKFLED
jgi:transcriptional regulator with XRE-family HTH domain